VSTACLLALAAPLAAQLAAQQLPTIPPNRDPNDWEAWFDAGAAIVRDKPAMALAAFEHASRLDPSRAEPIFARYVAFWLTEPWEDWYAWWDGNAHQERRPEVRRADSLYTLSLQRNPFVHRGLEIVLVDRISRGNFSRREDVRGWIAYSAGRFDEAVRLYARYVDRDPAGTLWTRWSLAISRVGANDLPGAATDLQYIIDELTRRDADAKELRYYRSKESLHYMIGLIQVQRRDLAAARAAFGEAIVENAGFAHAQAALALVERAERQMLAALVAFAQAIELAPDDAVLRTQYAQILLDAGRYDAAVTEARRSAALEPLWAAPYYIIGRARERQGRQAESTAAYREFVNRAAAADPQARALRQRLAP
jgi:hypothetical protein